jgi:hypothetical protein
MKMSGARGSRSGRVIEKGLEVDWRAHAWRVRIGLLGGVSACLIGVACSEAEVELSPPGAQQPIVEAEGPALAAIPAIPETQVPVEAERPSEPTVEAGVPVLDPLEGPEAPPLDAPPLDDLLRLPESVARAQGGKAGSEASGAQMDARTDAERKAAGLRVDVRRKKESAEYDPDGTLNRERADAGISVDVDEGASVRGGVQVEKNADEDWRDPVPTVGVEKRF